MAKVATPKKKATIKNNLSDPDTLPLTSKNPGKPGPAVEDPQLILLLDSIKGLYWTENHLLKSLPKVINSCYSKELKTAITQHWEITKKHVSRLEKIFLLLNKDPLPKKSDGMEGLTKEGECMIESTDPNTISRDLGIIMASQKIEHYEISAYNGLFKFATSLSLKEVADILNQTLAEEVKADDILSQIAEKVSKGKK